VTSPERHLAQLWGRTPHGCLSVLPGELEMNPAWGVLHAHEEQEPKEGFVDALWSRSDP